MLCQNTFIFGKYFHFCVLDINVTINGNNLKLKVKSEFSLSIGLMLISHVSHSIGLMLISYVSHSTIYRTV